MDDNELKVELAKQRTAQTKSIAGNTTAITAIIGAFATLITIFGDIRKENQAHERELFKTEMTFVVSQIDTDSVQNMDVRLRLAEYLMAVSPTLEQRDRWKEYYDILNRKSGNIEPEGS
jgi:hypothetical protein